VEVEPPHGEFDNSLQWRKEDIGEYNGNFFDNQETDLYVSTSSCEELEEDDFQEEYYALEEFRSWINIGGMKSVCIMWNFLLKKTHLREGERKRKRGDVSVALGGGSAGEGTLASPPL
jgi:hypothetical protein